MRTLLLVDASSWLFRSYYALPVMTAPNGAPSNALFGWCRAMVQLYEEYQPDAWVVVFDGPKSKQRRLAIDANYKAHRSAVDQALLDQIIAAQTFCQDAAWPFYAVEGEEADDVLATLARRYDGRVLIASQDKDLAQLVHANCFLVRSIDTPFLDPAGVEEKFGVPPHLIGQWLALVGDSADGIPGVPGIGPKTASQLLKKYGSLQAILAHTDQFTPKKRESFEQNRIRIAWNEKLVTLYDVVLPSIDTTAPLRSSSLDTVLQQWGFQSLVQAQQPVASSTETSWFDPQHALPCDPAFFWCEEVEGGVIGGYRGTVHGKPHAVVTQTPLPLALLAQFVQPTTVVWGRRYALAVGRACGEDLQSYAYTCGASVEHLAHLIRSRLQRPCCDAKERGGWDALDLQARKEYIVSLLDGGSILADSIDRTAPQYRLYHQVEFPLTACLTTMEKEGIYLDTVLLAKVREELVAAHAALEEKIQAALPNRINLNSPKQLAEALYDALQIPPVRTTKTGRSTDAATLAVLARHWPIANDLLQWRALEKLRSTYLDALPKYINPTTQRIHPHFQQTLTATGRLSCQHPNFQNIPIRTEWGRRIRHAVTAQHPEHVLLSIDYSQIELRILALLSGDTLLNTIFKEGGDVHQQTAAQLLGRPLATVTNEERYLAKSVNFGIVYGQQAFGLSQQTDLTVQQAKKFIETYFETYPDVHRYLEKCKEAARTHGYVETLWGRRRYVKDIHATKPTLRAAAERLAINTPVQGSAADIIKMAMVQLVPLLQDTPVRLILQVHDELVFEGPKEAIEAYVAPIVSIMEQVVQADIPFPVTTKIGRHWA